MFGLDITVIAFIGLVGLSVGGILFALLFNRVETERNQDRRISTIKKGSEGKNARIQMEAKKADANKRRQSLSKKWSFGNGIKNFI